MVIETNNIIETDYTFRCFKKWFWRICDLKYQIIVNRDGCIACTSCYMMDPAHYESDAAGKSQVVGGTTNGTSEGTFDDEKMAEAQAAADSCPVSVITVVKL